MKRNVSGAFSLSFTLVSLSTLYKVTRKEEEDKRSWKTIREVKDELKQHKVDCSTEW